MTDNIHYRGFRWAKSNAHPCPKPQEKVVASGYQAQDDASGFNVDLNAGDPVKLVSGGTVALANGGDAVWGIIVAVSDRGVWDANLGQFGAMRPSTKVPGGTAPGTNIARETRVLVVPASTGLWEIDANNNTSYTTEALYADIVGLNADHACTGVAADKVADPTLDMTTVLTTESLGWRIEGISLNRSNQDFTGENVKLIVSVNQSEEAAMPATRVVGV
jgi:hypothetical protein